MTTCRKAMMLYLAALLAIGGLAMGCGDDDDGGGDTDAGTDSGPPPEEDGGFDAGECVPDCTDKECGDDGCGGTCGDLEGMCPGGLECDEGSCPTTVFTRLAHLVPNAGGVRICAYVAGTSFGPLPDDSTLADGIEFRGVSGYVNVFTADPIDYNVRFYDATEVTDTCPAEDATTPEPIIEQVIAGGDLTPGSFYTIAAVGFADDGTADTLCGGTCEANQLAHVEIYDDDPTPPTDTAMTKVRFLHAVPNLAAAGAAAVDVCFDPDITDDTAEEVELFEMVTYPMASDYLETDPITMDSGANPGLRLYAHADPAANCVAAARLGNPIPIPYADPIGTDLAPGTVKDFPAEQTATIFTSGIAGSTDMATAVTPVPFADVPPTP